MKNNKKYLEREAKSLAAYFKKHPKSALNAVFIKDVFENIVDGYGMEAIQVVDAAKSVIGERMLGQIDSEMTSKALDLLETTLYTYQRSNK